MERKLRYSRESCKSEYNGLVPVGMKWQKSLRTVKYHFSTGELGGGLVNKLQLIRMQIYKTIISPLGKNLFMVLHLLCGIVALVAAYIWITALTQIDSTGGWILAVIGIYIALVALIEDARRDSRLQGYVRISSKLSEMDWETLATIKSGFHSISDIEHVVTSKMHTSRADVFRSIASLLKRGYIVDDESHLKYFLAPVTVHERSEG